MQGGALFSLVHRTNTQANRTRKQRKPMPQANTNTITDDDLINRAVNKTLSFAPWIERDELKQQAFAVLLRCRTYFDPSRGVPFSRYAWPCLLRDLAEVVRRQATPVSGSRRLVKQLAESRGVALPDVLSAAFAGRMPEPTPEDATALAELRATVRERVGVVLDEHTAALAAPVLFGSEQPSEVAARLSVDVRDVYNARTRARRRLVADPVLRSLAAGG